MNETISVAQTYIKEAVDGNDLTLELKIYRVMDLNQVGNLKEYRRIHLNQKHLPLRFTMPHTGVVMLTRRVLVMIISSSQELEKH